MLNKKVIIDKANRLHQMPPDILSFIQTSNLRPILKKPDLLDLGSFTWPVSFEAFPNPTAPEMAPASTEELTGLKEELAAWFLKHHHIKLNAAKEIYISGSIHSLVFSLALARLLSVWFCSASFVRSSY